MASPLYVLILAGGSGERFWPLSRKARPKQLLSLFGKETLLEGTLRRLEGLVDPEQILILTNSEQEAAVRSVTPQMPRENILAEPAKRDTAAAIALGVGWIAARAAHATMAVLPADHLIQDASGFQSTLRRAAAAARESGDLVTIGIKPSWPCPGFGYIELGTAVTLRNGDDGPPIHEVIRFREKPSAELAETFLQQGGFRWNAGMFIWTIPAILGAFERHAPVLAEFVARIHGRGDFAKLLRDVFPTLPKISIDYAIMEKARRVLTVEAAFDWDDVGSWVAAAKYFEKDAVRNCGNTTVKAIDAADNIVFCNDKRMVALMGVNDLIIVQTADALLVCNRRDAEKIKNLVTELPPGDAMSRVLGIDLGEARIGLAISDELGMLAHPLETIRLKEIKDPHDYIARIIMRDEVTAVILGLPRNMDGTYGPAAAKARAFADVLRTRISCPVHFWDERLTTVAAQRALHDAGRNAKQSRAVIDQVAAQLILQGYLDSQATGG